MPEEEKKAINIPELKKRFRNFAFYNLNKILRRAHLGELHEVDVEAATPTEIELKNEGLLVEFQSKIKLLDDVEQMWLDFDKWRKLLMSLYPEVGFMRHSEISMEESLAAKRGSRVKIEDSRRIEFEREFQKIDERNALIQRSGGQVLRLGNFESEVEELRDGKHYYSEWVPFKFRVNRREFEDYYPVPLAIPFRFWSSLLNDRDCLAEEYIQGYFGHTKVDQWILEYRRFFERVTNKAKEEIIRGLTDPQQIKKVEDNMKIIANAFWEKVLKEKVFTDHIFPRESDIFKKAKDISEKASEIEKLRNEFTQKTPESLGIKIHFRHTYLIVDHSRIEWPVFGESAGITATERFRLKYGDYAEDILKIKRYKTTPRKFEWRDFIDPSRRGGRRDGEFVAGLDENGWPLEVSDEGYQFPHPQSPFGRGFVLKDIFNGDPNPRRVPEEFIVPMDLLFMANCIHNEWDAVRDDLRDGRYHADSLTIVDYLMADTPCQFEDLAGKPEWGTMSEGRMEGNSEQFKTYTMYYLDNNFVPQEVVRDGKRRPSNLIPAFDKRAKGRPFVHLGRKYYYQTARDILQIKDEDLNNDSAQLATGPFISTRGISGYIITKILSRMKYFDEAKKRLDVIAKKQGVWYDHGPREIGKKGAPPLGPWD